MNNRNYEEEQKKRLRTYVAHILAYERMAQEKSQQEIANMIGTSKSNISRLEKGDQNMTVDYIQAIAASLGKEAKFTLEEPTVDYGDSSVYELRLYDEVLMEFRLTRKLDLHAEIISINEDRKHMLPLELEVTDEGVKSWLRKRVIPGNRELAGTVLRYLNLDMGDLKGIVDVCLGLSLNDSYWVVQKGFDGCFADYNLYENRFDEALSIVAYVGHGNSIRKFRTSPELTTGGMLRKAWHFIGKGNIYLYKSGTSGYANSGNEPYSEFLACQVAEKMGLNAVHYDLENWHGILASKCKLFTDIDTSYIPIGRIVRYGGIDACLEYCKNISEEMYQDLVSLLAFDAVVVNEDRHYGNFGVLRNNITGEITGLAPIFDNGISLLCYAMKDDLTEKLDDYINQRSNPYGADNTFLDLAKRLIGPRQRRELRKLINFKFVESDLCNLPSWRIRILEDIIQQRVRELLA